MRIGCVLLDTAKLQGDFMDKLQMIALKKMFTGKNVFLSGTGGTGKSAVIRIFLENSPKNIVCVAPTGLVALNLPEAMTIHSFFKFPIDKIMLDVDDVLTDTHLVEILHSTDCIVIDEISMVRADIFNAVNLSMKANGDAPYKPFGGKQIIVVGDFLQLPPVVTNEAVSTVLHERFGGVYAFNTNAWKEADFCSIYLDKVHRQRDPEWVAYLEMIRHRSPGVKKLLETNPIPVRDTPRHGITLCCRKASAERINEEGMSKLSTPGIISTGETKGIFPEYELPVPSLLTLKTGCRVMVVCNGKRQKMPGYWHYEYVNGEIGTVYGFDRDIVCLKMDNGRHIKVKKSHWSNIAYELGKDENGKSIVISKEIGSYMQFPLIPGWAMSIHKAQGQTINCRTHLCLGQGCFAPGQLYTALSRVQKFDDLSVDRPIRYADIIVDSMVLDFLYETFPDQFIFSDMG